MNGDTGINRGSVYNSIQYTDVPPDSKALMNTTYPLCVRVPIYYYMKYSDLDRMQKKLFRDAVISLLQAFNKVKPANNQPVIVNLNMNINQNHNQNEAKASSKVDIKIYTEIRSSLEELFKWLNWIANPVTNTNLPPYLKDQAAKQRNKLAHVLQELERMVN